MMKIEPPKLIYLQIGGTKYDRLDGTDVVDGEEITWCEDRINESDLVYALKDDDEVKS